MTIGLSVRPMAAALACALVMASTGGFTAQSQRAPLNPCSTGEPAARLAACTQQLAQRGLATAARVTAYVSRGTTHEALDQHQDALKDFGSALELDPDSAVALRARAAALHRRGRTADALLDLARAIGAHPDDTTPLKLRATIHAETGQLARAVEDFSKVLDQAPGDLMARQGRGLALAASGDHGRAIQDFTRVLGREPRARTARAARAFSLFRTRQYQGAIVDWTLLLEEDPSQLAVVYCRGAAKVLSGDGTGRADMERVELQKPDVAAAQATSCPAS